MRVEQVPWAAQWARVTTALARAVALLARKLSWAEVAALGWLADAVTGSSPWWRLLLFAAGVLGLGMGAATLLRGWLGARHKVVAHGRYLVFQMAEVAVPQDAVPAPPRPDRRTAPTRRGPMLTREGLRPLTAQGRRASAACPKTASRGTEEP